MQRNSGPSMLIFALYASDVLSDKSSRFGCRCLLAPLGAGSLSKPQLRPWPASLLGWTRDMFSSRVSVLVVINLLKSKSGETLI